MMNLPLHRVIATMLFCALSASAQTSDSISEYERWGEMLRRENHPTVIAETTAELARNPRNALALRMRARAYANVEQVPGTRTGNTAYRKPIKSGGMENARNQPGESTI